MDDDELDFGTTKTRGARQGRRAAAPAAELDQDELDTPVKSDGAGRPQDRPNKAVSGWGEEMPRKPRTRQLGEGFESLEEPTTQVSTSKQNKGAWDPVEDLDKELDDFDLLFGFGTQSSNLGGSSSPDLFRERLRPSSPAKDDSDSDNDIPVIPELEEQTEDDLSSRVATAPNVAVNRVATYRELDNDLLRQAAFQVLDNEIDLKLLTKSLSPMEDLIEEDLPWDWDRLFTEVSSELTTEWEKTKEDGETEPAET